MNEIEKRIELLQKEKELLEEVLELKKKLEGEHPVHYPDYPCPTYPVCPYPIPYYITCNTGTGYCAKNMRR